MSNHRLILLTDMKQISLFLSLIISLSVANSYARENDGIDHVVYLVGNTATRELDSTNLLLFSEYVSLETHPFSIIHLGDILKPDNGKNSVHELDYYLDLVKERNGMMYFIPGDKDWNNSENKV